MAEGIMTTVSNSRERDLPRSPTSMSPTSSRRESLRSSNNTERESASSSSPARLTRKRAASLDTVAANHPSIQDLSIHGSGLDSPRTDSGNQVCLCQPDPKVPRPRNAFILYRQHYQGQVIAQNPGLANPEISKIIGAQWREQPLEVKNEWKRLAEEEKHRHQRQYPDYRYQPRRAGKPNSSRAISSPDEHLRCPKCNGRFISTPNTPLTPFPPTPATGSRIERPISTFSRHTADEMMNTDRNYSNPAAPLNSPRAGPPYQQMQHRRPPVPLNQSGRPYRDEDIEMLQSPRAKRPRPNDLQNSYPSPSWPNGPQRLNRGAISAAGYNSARVPNQREIVFQHHGNPGMMEPPPRPTPMSAQFPSHAPTHVRPQNMDDLRLPPLQTQLPGPGSAPLQQQQHQSQSQQNSSLSHSRTIEAMIMTIPFLNKIKVLAKIAPPLSTPGPTSPAQEVRGPVIAVEGADQKLVAEVGRYIEEHLNKEAEYFVKTWISDNASFGNHSELTAGDVSMAGMGKDSPAAIDLTKDNDDTDPIFEYLKEIGTWHAKSAEIRKFITTLPTTAPSASRTSSSTSNHPASPSCSPTSTPAPIPTPNPSSTAPPTQRLPVALLPTGFSLSISDRAASKIPIEDAYAPVDHWQWMATLWRGIVGVDLTVYVCSSARGEDDGGRGGVPALGGVEVRTDARAIVVRAQNGRVEDKWLRRVGFEVGEWVRGAGGGSGLK